jgi:hypothetical protein
MEKDKILTAADLAVMRELAAELEKLPEAVRIKFLYMIEGAKLMGEGQRAS